MGEEARIRPDTRALTRRTLLQLAGGVLAGSTLGALDLLAWAPQRIAGAPPPRLSDIQFDLAQYIAPARSLDGVLVRLGPVFTVFVTARLNRTPTERDRSVLAAALDAVEHHYEFSPAGCFCFVSYGIPYFERLPGGMSGPLVRRFIPRLLGETDRYVLEEAIASPTDVSATNPSVRKARFNVPVVIEDNDLLLTVRSDSLDRIRDVVAWLTGSDTLHGTDVRSPDFDGLFSVTSTRVQFQQLGLPRRVADQNALPYAQRINPGSPMWMGFVDQQVAASGPAAITTFCGDPSARVTTAREGDYFDKGSIQHLSHVILDLEQFYGDDEPYTERVQYMFRSNPIPSTGHTDQFTDGGGPTSLPNTFHGTQDALHNAQALDTYQGRHRMGHTAALQRSSRAKDGTAMHIRMDGPGFDTMDVPGGTLQPKLQFTVFVPSAQFFRTMRRNQASLDLVRRYGVQDDDNGLERFITATRRQNYLVPPRRHRAFPLLELRS